MNMVVKNDDLVISTHGRGIWILDNISSLRSIAPDVTAAKVHLFDVAPAFRRLRGGRGWTRIKSLNVAQNPPRGVVIEYYLASAAAEEITLAINDASGEVIQTYIGRQDQRSPLSGVAGMHRFVWDMRYPGVALPASAGALPDFESSDHSPPSRPVAMPGQYAVRLTVDGKDFERPFEILKDSRMTASDADLRAQFELMTSIQARVSAVTDEVLRVRDVRADVQDRYAERLDGEGVDIAGILEQLDDIEGTLTIWMGSEDHPMMFGPPGLIQKLSRLSGAVIAGDARPTASMFAVFEDLSERFENQRRRLNQIIDQNLAPTGPDEQEM
jgi:hypothetical protein